MQPKVLIMEADDRAFGRTAMELGGASVVLERDAEAVATLIGRGERFDLVVCDLANGRRHAEYAQALRALMDNTEGTLLAIVSDDPDEAAAYSDAGVCVLHRPVRNDHLRALLDFAMTSS